MLQGAASCALRSQDVAKGQGAHRPPVAPLHFPGMARSVAELLPRPFAELTLDDVAGIIETIGDEHETLFFERKATIGGNALAKTCASFANTYGGLLVGGVADNDDALTGMDPL